MIWLNTVQSLLYPFGQHWDFWKDDAFRRRSASYGAKRIANEGVTTARQLLRREAHCYGANRIAAARLELQGQSRINASSSLIRAFMFSSRSVKCIFPVLVSKLVWPTAFRTGL